MAIDYIQDIRRLAVTFTLALGCGWAFLHIGLPAPYLMGSMFGVWFTGGAIKPLRQHLGVARWFHIPVVLGLGVLIGANFAGDHCLSGAMVDDHHHDGAFDSYRHNRAVSLSSSFPRL